MKKKLTIPEFKSIQEEAQFWDTNDSEDYQWEPVTDIKFSKNLVSVYEGGEVITLDDETVRAVKKVAKKKGLETSATAEMLIKERLSEMKIL